MEYINKSVNVSKEAYEVMDMLNTMVVSMKAKLADGFQIADVISTAMESMPKIVVAMQGAEKIIPEYKLDPGASLAAGAVGGMEIMKSLMK